MAMTGIDWVIVATMFLLLLGVALLCQRQVKSVADFLVAGRSAGRYMLTVGGGMVWIGAVNIIAMFELYHGAGLVAMWWSLLVTPFAIYLAISGFGVYRFRQTRAMTIAQFLEMRYNRTVRVMAGVISWSAGMLAFGIFPAVGARFFMNFCGFPGEFEWLGVSWSVFPLTMAALISASLFFVFVGGHLTVLVTDFLQGAFASVTGLIIILALAFGVLNWTHVVESLKLANDRRTMSSASSSLTTAGVTLAQAGEKPYREDYAAAGSSLAVAGTLLQSVSNARPSAMAFREIVGRLCRNHHDRDEMARMLRESSDHLVSACDQTLHAPAAAAVRDLVEVALHEAGVIPAPNDASAPSVFDPHAVIEASQRFPRDEADLRFMASVMIADAATRLTSVDPTSQPGMALLKEASDALRGNDYPLEAAALMQQAGTALEGAAGPARALAAPLSAAGDTIARRTTSMLDPVNTAGVSDFNFWYFLIAVIGMWWAVMSIMQAQAYFASAKSAHEMRMGNVLGQWRWLGMCLLLMMLVLATFVYTEHPAYVAEANEINASLDVVAERVGASSSVAHLQAGTAVRNQQVVPVAMRHFLPAGLVGLFCAMVLAALISTYDSFMHSWGSVFVQDVIVPFRRRPLGPREHIWWLRFAVLKVAAIAFLFSWIYPQNQSILMFFAIANSIWLAPSGAVLIGGLYWQRGTSAAAIITLIVGVSFGLLGVGAIHYWPVWYDHPFPINAQWLFFMNIVLSAITYVGVSLMSRVEINFDQILHRGAYAIEENRPRFDRPTTFIMKCFGITREFTRGDRITAYIIVGWFLAMFAVFIVGTLAGKLYDIGEDAWATFWYFYLGLLFAVTIITTFWFTIGGFVDMRRLFQSLKTQQRDFSDDGRVIHPAATAPVAEEAKSPKAQEIERAIVTRDE